MRAILKINFNYENNEIIEIEGEQAHHLLNVARSKIGDEVLIFNGKGKIFNSLVDRLDRKKLYLKILSSKQAKKTFDISLGICIPKKEAMESILKIAVELGISNIFPIVSKFSQANFELSKRQERIIESAIEQSNNSYLPTIHAAVNFKSFLEESVSKYKQVIYFSSKQSEKKFPKLANTETLYIIGPEGGLYIDEENSLIASSSVFSCNLPIPIMRCPTAVSLGMGMILQSFES
jgi:16S rRNA (uracil1498-N3)-methyltransferase